MATNIGTSFSEDRARKRDADDSALFYHGGNLGAARSRFAGAPEPWIDLSTGINPVAYPVSGLAADDFARLPEPGDLLALRRAAARAYRVSDPACVVAAPGTQALLQWLPWLLPARRVAVLGFSYAEHARRWSAAGSLVTAAEGLTDLAGADVAVVVNPNNPDGRLVPAADLLALAADMAARGGVLVVDEAFIDVLPVSASVAPAAESTQGLVVLRSFGKTYGLAGLRLGFALAEPALAARIADALGPWAVAGPALAIGRRALSDPAWLAAACARLRQDRLRLDALMAGHGLAPSGGTPLFRLYETERAQQTFAALGRLGVLVRGFGDRPRWLRLGLPAPAAWRLLEERLSGLRLGPAEG